LPFYYGTLFPSVLYIYHMRKHIERINKAITFTFYALFLTTPLAMHPNTSELFELNKMWLVYIYTLIIFALWGTKIVIEKKFEVRRTPFDIPLLLFLASQVLSTIFSMDSHTSFWGYYSRFNGGLLSTLCYVFLYFAFATNVLTQDREESFKRAGRMLLIVFISGVLVALWGLPSHFGYDPTCLAFRGTLDVNCWTEAFQPKVRMFSTLGQPNWLAAFLMILLPIGTAYTINAAKKIKKNTILDIPLFKTAGFLLATLLFYLDLGWTLSQSGFVGFWVGNLIFVLLFTVLIIRKNSFSPLGILKQKSFQLLIVMQILFLLTTFFTVNPIPRLQKFSYYYLNQQSKPKTDQTKTPAAPAPTAAPQAQPALESSITGSGDIRKIVWKGAIDIWKAYPVFGSGVETYAFAYYRYRPVEHNMTSEWDYLYNKAHNEFLNYLATTGALGLGTYLLFLVAFLFFALRHMIRQLKNKVFGDPLLPAFVGSFFGIAVSNFFGFSVVNVNLLMFLIPLFYWSLTKPTHKLFVLPKGMKEDFVTSNPPGTGGIMAIGGIVVFSLYCILFLVNYWNADLSYGLGYNYNRINEFATANPLLEKAVQMRGGEDLYKNELSVNLAALALTAASQNDAANATQFATRAKELSDSVAKNNPNNVVYWKARTRVMYSLSQLSPTVINEAVAAIEKSHQLAPTDAKVIYNQALIYDQIGKRPESIELLNQTIKMKPNYRDAYYAKALYLSEMATAEKDNKEKAEQMKNEAKDTLNFVIKNLNPQDQQAIDLLKTLE